MARSLFGALVLAATLAGSPACAVPLEAAACTGLDHERSTLEAAGVVADLRMTADQAKALAKDRLERIERYVEISGQILFRCQTAAAAADAHGKGQGDAETGKTKTAAKRKTVALRKKH